MLDQMPGMYKMHVSIHRLVEESRNMYASQSSNLVRRSTDWICGQRSLLPRSVNTVFHVQPNPSRIAFVSLTAMPLTPKALTWLPLLNRCRPTATFQPSSSCSTTTYLLPSWSRMVALRTCIPLNSPLCARRLVPRVMTDRNKTQTSGKPWNASPDIEATKMLQHGGSIMVKC